MKPYGSLHFEHQSETVRCNTQRLSTPLERPRHSRDGAATNVATQSYEVTLQQGDEGMGPPPHSHRWDESFYVLKGSVEFTCAAETAICGPGTLVHVPAHTVHAFRFGEHGGEMLEMSGQGGLATQMFTAVNDEIPAGPPDIRKVVQVLKQNGVTVSV